MKRISACVYVATTMMMSSPAAAASFDCAKASTADEHIVCDMPLISHLDDLLKSAYAQAREKASEDVDVPRMARDFLADRHGCGDDRACVLSSYLGILLDYSYLGADYAPSADISADTVAMGRAPVSADVPEKIGQCVRTAIEEVHPRIGDSFDGGTGVDFANQGYQVTYDRDEAVIASKPGDTVVMCLISIPHHCPDGDDRGRVYLSTNMRTGKSWTLPDSQHACGGA